MAGDPWGDGMQVGIDLHLERLRMKPPLLSETYKSGGPWISASAMSPKGQSSSAESERDCTFAAPLSTACPPETPDTRWS